MFSSNASQVSSDAVFIEDVMSTFLYAGTGAAQTITNGIDLAGEGGMVWVKGRDIASNNAIHDTARGVNNYLVTDTTGAQANPASNTLTAFNTNGFSLGSANLVNRSTFNFASWTFRKQPKFFDIATYTTVSGAMTIPHNLGSVPGCWIIKSTSVGSAAPDWWFYHRSIPGQLLRLNGTGAVESGFSTATSTNITISAGVFTPGETLVIYLYAHDAGGFGLSGSDNVISCGSYTVSTLAQITLGYEPQLLLARKTSGTGSQWYLLDSMRGFSLTDSAYLRPNVSSIESSSGAPGFFSPTATGFIDNNQVFTNGDNVIYIAIRRGPMKVPELGTTVFKAISTPASTTVTAGFVPDFVIAKQTDNGVGNSSATYAGSRLQGNGAYLSMSDTSAEGAFGWQWNDPTNKFTQTSSGAPTYSELFARAPGFFDVVCYTGTGSARTVAHNLAAVPELMIVKGRSGATAWQVYSSALANTEYLVLNTTAAKTTGATRWNSTTPTSSVFSLGTASEINTSAATYVAYLFATCAGVSKVGSYTGTAATQVINCGFTTGARFVLIKRTDSTGDWYYWDSARGIIAGNDPYLLMNSTAVEVTGTDYVDTAASGFELTSTAPAAINASGGSFVFLAIS